MIKIFKFFFVFYEGEMEGYKGMEAVQI